jgi:hypothetical protein
LISRYFEWNDGLYAGSVLQAALPKIKDFIQRQESHPEKVFFVEELDMLIQVMENQHVNGKG